MDLSVNDVKYIIAETTKRLLKEITVKDAYQRYYSDIEDTHFKTIVYTINGENPILLPETKWVLSLYKKMGKIVLEDLYKLTNQDGYGYLDIFKRLKERRMISGKEADLNQYKTIAQLGKFVNGFDMSTVMGRTKGEMSNAVNSAADDVEILYEDEEWKVVVPYSYEASCYWGKGTEWCTATRETDEYFNSYTQTGPLFINIKKNGGDKFQFHFESNSYMDAYDCEIESPVFDELAFNDNIREFYSTIVSKEKYMDLSYYNIGERKEGPWLLAKDNDGPFYGRQETLIGADEMPISDEWFNEIYDFRGSFATVKRDGKFNFINRNAEILSETWFDYALSSFINDTWVEVGMKSNKTNMVFNMLNDEGKIVYPQMWFDKIENTYSNRVKVWKDGIAMKLTLNGILTIGDTGEKLERVEDFEQLKKHLFDRIVASQTQYYINYHSKNGRCVSPHQVGNGLAGWYGIDPHSAFWKQIIDTAWANYKERFKEPEETGKITIKKGVE